jgi:hypothetical protein
MASQPRILTLTDSTKILFMKNGLTSKADQERERERQCETGGSVVKDSTININKTGEVYSMEY